MEYHEYFFLGSVVAQAVSRCVPTAAARVLNRTTYGLCRGQSGIGTDFLLVTSASTANHSTDFSNIMITRGWHNRPIGGRSAECTQLDSALPQPNYTNLI
jgi:hypothetical protein